MEKYNPKFKYGDKVIITKGFFRGNTLTLVDVNKTTMPLRYRGKFNSLKPWTDYQYPEDWLELHTPWVG